MMEGWLACFFVLIVDLAFSKDIPVSNATYVIKPIDSCPAEGYFFKKEPPTPNFIRGGPCYLCFCRDNGTAVCWERDHKRCDVEKYHHHRVGRHSRFRRSPIGLKDIFFPDKSRDFIKKELPQECNPAGESFSDGCPPADWCIGCTVCDCGANGRWDCHVLSFCDGKEKSKKLKGISKRKGLTSLIEKKIQKKPTKSIKKRSSNPKASPTAKVKKFVKKQGQPTPKNNTQQQANNNKKPQPKKQVIRRPPPKKYLKKKPHPKNRVTKRPQIHIPKSNVSRRKYIRKNVPIREKKSSPQVNHKNVVKKLNPNNNSEAELGQRIVKQVMTAVHKLLLKEIGIINSTRKQRSIKLSDGRDCSKAKKNNKKAHSIKSKAAAKIRNRYKKGNFAKVNWKGLKGRYKREVLDDTNPDNINITVITLSPDTHAVLPLEAPKLENSSMNYTSSPVAQHLSTTSKKEEYFYKYFFKDDSYVNLSSVINNTTAPTPVKNESQYSAHDMYFSYVVPIVQRRNETQTYTYETTTERSYHGSRQRNELGKKYNSTTQSYFSHTTRNNVPLSYSRNQLFNNNKTDVTGLSIILQNLLKELKNKTAKVKPKPKISIMKYVRKFFRKVFAKKKTGGRKKYGIGPKEDHTLQTLCENIGPCKIDKKNKFVLKYKLKRLNDETKTILRSIGIIKGLLHLLDLPGTPVVTTDAKNSHSFHNDVRKLSAVLRDNYISEDNNVSLSDTQMTQISYIKNNTQTFIESVKKFADILNETIALIQPNVDFDNPSAISLKKEDSEKPLKTIKKILFKYNLIQNTFMRRMYELINGVENNITSTTTTTSSRSEPKENHMRCHDKVIQKYSNDIIGNLRRLKNLAQVLSSKRKKRDSRVNDDALDYLLTLMEYLIKQNHSLDSVPANDGIDFLIDAIRNAPDIKSIKKKVLGFNSTALNMRFTTDLSDQLPDDSNSESNRISKEESQQIKNEHLLSNEEVLINKENFILRKENIQNVDSINKKDDILEGENNWPVERAPEIIDNAISKGYYKFIDTESTLIDNVYHTTTEYNTVQKNKSYDVTDKTGFEKFESNIDESKKFEVFNNDIDDDATGEVSVSPSSTLNGTGDSEQSADEQTTLIPKTIAVKLNGASSESQDTLNEMKKSKLDWIDETFEKQIRKLGELITAKPTHTPSMDQITSPTTVKNVENQSGITVEVESTVAKRKKHVKKSKNDDVIYQKQLAFLTSLDYGAMTEKLEFEESVSGEDAAKSDDGVPYFIAK